MLRRPLRGLRERQPLPSSRVALEPQRDRSSSDRSLRDLHGEVVYAGRNLAYDNKQTGLWTKQATDVVFSENTVHGHRPSNSSGGAGIGVQYGPERVWVIFNRIYDCEMGITSSTNVGDEDDVAGTGEDVYLLGNLIYDIHKQSGEPPETDPWQAGSGIHLTDQDASKHIVHNTIHDTDVAFTYARGTGPVHLANNIFTGSLGVHVRVETGEAAAASTIRNTLVDEGGTLRWGDGVTHDLAGFQAAFPGLCVGCVEGDPGFVAADDHALTAGSPALDSGAVSEVEATFESLYGLSISAGIDATSRPQGDEVDMGCYEQ